MSDACRRCRRAAAGSLEWRNAGLGFIVFTTGWWSELTGSGHPCLRRAPLPSTKRYGPVARTCRDFWLRCNTLSQSCSAAFCSNGCRCHEGQACKVWVRCSVCRTATLDADVLTLPKPFGEMKLLSWPHCCLVERWSMRDGRSITFTE